MPQIRTHLGLLGAHALSICLLCRSRPPPWPRTSFGVAARNVSVSSTSIKASFPTLAKNEKSVVVDGLAELVRAGFAGEGRVRLAVRGLERQDAGVRVAVLGRSGSEGRLVAVLLADPLSMEPEKERWMKDIVSWSSSLREGKKGSLLIRYGPPSKITTPSGSPVSLLSVPSPLLKSSSLEILLAPLSPTSEDHTVITLQATEIPGARVIEYPVHKTLLWAGEGPDGLSTLLRQKCASTGPVLKALSLTTFNSTPSPEGDVMVIDLKIAEDAVAQLEKSTGSITTIKRGLIQSGVEKIQGWIVAGTSRDTTEEVKPAVKDLAFSIISEAESLIQKEEDGIIATKKKLENRVISTSSLKPDNMDTLSVALRNWSQTAHSELQDSLDAAFRSKTWNELAWWKLLWASDDVTSNSRDVLAIGFLPESRKKLLFLAGRFSGAGYRGDSKGETPIPTATSMEEELAKIRKYNIIKMPQSVAVNKYLGSLHYYPQSMFCAKNSIIEDTIPRLQASANKLLMHSFSLSISGVLVSAMLYMSEISVYSSSSVAVLAIVYSARFLQKRWEKERKWFQDSVSERGRAAIAQAERWGWERLREGVKIEEHEKTEDVCFKKVEEGRKAIKDIRRALEEL